MEPLAWFAYIALLLFGLVFGSFANVVIWRLPRGESVATPGSHCPSCDHPIRSYDNIPIVSWLLLRGRCRDCGSPISGRYPLIEVLSGLLWLAAALRFGLSWQTPACIVLFYTLLLLAAIDIDTQRLPNLLVAVLAAFGILGAVAAQLAGVAVVPLVGLAERGVFSAPLVAAASGAIIGGGISGLIAATYALVRGKRGLGMGDLKLLAAMGLFTGAYVLLALLFGSLAGTFWGLLAVFGRGKKLSSHKIPFGPFLALGCVAAVLAGPQLWSWYLSLLT